MLRALAALAVCLYHFGRESITSIGTISSAVSFGYLGVDVFFVISGFVIPLMLYRMKYRFSDYGSFLIARFLRLYPAYAIAGALSLALWYLSLHIPGFRGQSPPISISYIVSNSLLLCDFTGHRWIVPVFWTLAIEAQYYVLIGVSFPLLTNKSYIIRYSVMVAWIVAPLIVGKGPSVFTWTALFTVGILCYLRSNGLIGRLSFWILFCAALTTHAMTKGSMSAAVGAATGLAIVYLPELHSRVLNWVGGISYSLYLIHELVGGRVIQLAMRLPDRSIVQALALLLAVFVSIIAAAIFFKLIEGPSHKFSRSVRTGARR